MPTRKRFPTFYIILSRPHTNTKQGLYFFYLNINQLDALNFIMSLFHASTCLEHMCSSSGGQNGGQNFDLLTMSTCARNM